MAKKQKKKHLVYLLLFIILLGGAASGYFIGKHITKNDVFEVVGEKVITLELGQTYTDEGAKAIFFGKDISNKIQTENNIDYEKCGEYYICYTINNTIYKNIKRYRAVIIQEPQSEVEE